MMRKQNLIFTLLLLPAWKLSLAHDMDGTLGPSASASDYYQVHCYDDRGGAGPTERLAVDLLTTGKAAPVVSLQVSTESPLKIYSTTDPISGDSTFSTTIYPANDQPDTTLSGKPHNANGYYYVSVNKTQAGIQSYHFTYHCESSIGHSGTDIAPLQDQ